MNVLDFNVSNLKDSLIVTNGDHVTMLTKGIMLEFTDKIIAYYYTIGELPNINDIIKADKTLPVIIGYYARYKNNELKLTLFRSMK